MSTLITTARPVAAIALPEPRVPIVIRPARMEDLPFIDALQKKHSRQLGYFHRKTLEGKIGLGHVLIAEMHRSEPRPSGRGSEVTHEDVDQAPSPIMPEPVAHAPGSERVGYVIGCDRYFKREDCGIIYQLCVAEGTRRSLVGAMLVKAMFDRAAYGCRLFCCWCAQDIEANRFWESLGFVPLAFRAGSATRGRGGKARVHIFWQKRIRAGDETTPWWFPSQTTGGSIRADRLVLPISPDTHWSDARPTLLPEEPKMLPAEKTTAARRPRHPHHGDPIAKLSVKERRKMPVNVVGGLRFVTKPEPGAVGGPASPRAASKPAPALARKNNPNLIAFARELRDRWLERVSDDPSLLLPAGKYDVARGALPDYGAPATGTAQAELIEVKALPAAA